MGILQKIASGAVKAILSYVDLWITRKQERKARQEARTRKGKLKSYRNVRKLEKEIEKETAEQDPPKTPTEWNKNKASIGVLLLVTASIASCCGPTYVESRWPVLDTPERPKLQVEDNEFTPNERKLVGYANRLENVIEAYNSKAKRHNLKHGYRKPEGKE